jgi:hypothetical protein
MPGRDYVGQTTAASIQRHVTKALSQSRQDQQKSIFEHRLLANRIIIRSVVAESGCYAAIDNLYKNKFNSQTINVY